MMKGLRKRLGISRKGSGDKEEEEGRERRVERVRESFRGLHEKTRRR